MVASYRELTVWRKAMELVVAVYSVTSQLPRDERFGLADQLRRAAVSIPSNIAEGHARQSQREFAHFLSVALGSLAEVDTQLDLATRLELLDATVVDDIIESIDHLRAMLLKLLKSIRNRAAGVSDGEPPDYLIEESP